MDTVTTSDPTPAPPAARRRRRGWLWAGGVALVAVVAANHLEYRHRCPPAAGPARAPVAVRREGGALAGHNTIGIDETAAGSAAGALLRFATLGEWPFDPKAPAPCPPSVQAWNGRDVTCVGFMYPLEPGAALRSFCLLRTTQTCCYGPRPQYNQYLLVEMKSPTPFERLRPVLVRGRFVVDPQPDQGFIYRLEGTACTRASDDEPEVDPAAAARQAGLPQFDFAWLAEAEGHPDDALPPALAAMDGKPVVVTGHFVQHTAGPPACVLVAKEWWDGVSKGVRPTPYTALPAYPRDPVAAPPLWQDRGTLTGRLRVEPDPRRWPEVGVASLQDAVRGVPGSGRRGPFLKPWHEAALLALLALGVWRSRRIRAGARGAAVQERSVDHA